MPERPRVLLVVRRASAWWLAWLCSAALYLVLIDITDLPELIVGAGAAAIAATGFELAREHHTAGGLRGRLRYLRRLYRPLLKVPSDIGVVSRLAVRQLLRPRAVNGVFRTAPFRPGESGLETGRCALAESFGSFAPNTIIVGVDVDRELLLGHQLRGRGGDEAIDVLGLGPES